MSKTKSILIVEDEAALRNVYKLVLDSKGYQTFTANNGEEGLIQLKKNQPDLVLLDIFMPVMDGKEFMRNINPEDYSATKIVVYSNLSNREIEAEMLKLGAHKFILKSSMSPKDLLELVQEMIPE